MLLPIAVAGCAQVFGIEGWSEQSAGGAGGEQSASSSASSGTASSAGGMASSSISTGGQGGQGPASSSASSSGGGPASSSASSSGGGPASSSASTSGQGGTGGTVGLDEICDNGADDDFDGGIDCADTDCIMAGFQCAKGMPLPWHGPVVLYTGPANNPLPPCGEGWANPTDHLAGTLMSDPIQCGSCTCSMPTGGQCVLPAGVGVNVYADTNCGPPPEAFTGVSQPNVCTFVNNPTPTGADYSVGLAGQAIVYGGSCAPSAGVPVIPPASFSERARICERATMASGCATNYACASPPPAQFKNAVCIYQQLDDNTPPSFCPMPYGLETMLYTAIKDERSCTACQCAPASGTCATKLSLFFDQACSSAPFDLMPGNCGLLINDGAGLTAKITVGTSNGAVCPPIPPVPQGTVKGTGRTQVCCMP